VILLKITVFNATHAGTCFVYSHITGVLNYRCNEVVGVMEVGVVVVSECGMCVCSFCEILIRGVS
jgi:hypothetical protein